MNIKRIYKNLDVIRPVRIITVGMLIYTCAASAMVELEEEQLAKVTGQALLQMGKTGGEVGTISENLTFYKAGLDAEVALNMNIEKLQLGCTAASVNGQHCDIDIDRLGLSGSTWGPEGRAASSAILTRPFFEFAIKNDGNKTLREVVGIRLSAENTQGMLTFGDQQAGPADPGNTSGINSLSGYMKLGATSGTARTQVRAMTYDNYSYDACIQSQDCIDSFGGTPPPGDFTGLNAAMAGRIYLDTLGIGTKEFTSTDYGLLLFGDTRTEGAAATVNVPSTAVSGKRLTSVPLTGSAVIDPINFSGQMAANVDNVALGIDLEVDKTVTGTISGLTASVPIQQSLKYIHKINVDDSPFSLSMQKEDVRWLGAQADAQAGWWLAFDKEIDIGNISPEDEVAITNQVLLDALGDPLPNYSPTDTEVGDPVNVSCAGGPSINCSLSTALTGDPSRTYCEGLGCAFGGGTDYYSVHGVYCSDLADCLGGSLNVGNLNVPANINFPLSDLKLSEQSVVPNCFGSARFC